MTSPTLNSEIGSARVTEREGFSPEALQEALPHLTAQSYTGVLELLYRVVSNQYRYSGFQDRVNAILSIGKARFGCEHAFVLRQISDQVLELICVSSASERYYSGQHLPRVVFDRFSQNSKIKAVPESSAAGEPGVREMLSEYKLSGAYIGIKLTWQNPEPVILCFMSDSQLKSEFGKDNSLLLELMADGVACMMELQRTRVQRKHDDLALQASGSLKSLEEYQSLAELPETLGIPGKVVACLQKRIGHSSLSIDSIADDLNLSKRTLQRRLQQHGISFAELRDKVRFHFAIGYLVSEQTSIDRISSTLDFSDRTSFTNAFKRWTGLSPSTFRKVFRDYA